MKNITCYIYNSSLEILMAISLKNSNLSVEEPKFYIMKNLDSLKHNPKTSLLQELESCCKYFVHMLYICRQTYKRYNHAILFSQLIAHNWLLNHKWFCFNFMMLHHWLGFQDGFNIKRQHVCTTFLDIKKYLKECYQAKIRIQTWWTNFKYYYKNKIK
jgi:hypothetical protein